MPASPSEIFDFLAATPNCSIERYELHLPAFADLRRSMGSIVLRLRETEDPDAIDVSDAIRIHLSEWLTVPVPFDNALLEWPSLLGDPTRIEMRWGADVRKALDVALDAARELQQIENPARTKLREVLLGLSAEGGHWRIFCHRRVRGHFESISHAPFSADAFLHTVTDYRDTAPFDVLLKVGPLRSRGWGAAPDALLSAPRFRTLMQFVWSGSADEEGFGLDPVTTASRSTSDSLRDSISGVRWTRRTIPTGDTRGASNAGVEFDELKVFHEISRGSALRRAVLIDVGDDYGILLPPNAEVPSFDPEAHGNESPFGLRVPGETLAAGMFLIRAQLGDMDLGGVQAADGHYSRLWKQRLAEEYRRDSSRLVQQLRAAGLNLQHLAGRARRWFRRPTTVIHAPQQRKHFEILIKVLGIDHDPSSPASVRRRSWWQYAWNEIAHSRGEAIQTGMQEQEILYEELFSVLMGLLPDLRSEAAAGNSFRFAIPDGRSLRGVVHFYRVRSIDDGFLVPDHAMKQITELDAVEQWRA